MEVTKSCIVAELGGREPGRRALASAPNPPGPAGGPVGVAGWSSVSPPQRGDDPTLLTRGGAPAPFPPSPGPLPTQLSRAVCVPAGGGGRVSVAAAMRPDRHKSLLRLC